MLICWRSGGALGYQRRALRSQYPFPILYMGTTHGGGAGEADEIRDGGKNKRAGAGDGSAATNGGKKKSRKRKRPTAARKKEPTPTTRNFDP